MRVGEQIELTNIPRKELEKFVEECNRKLHSQEITKLKEE